MSEDIEDYLVVTTDGKVSDELEGSDPLFFDQPIEFVPNLYFGNLDYDLAERIMDACTPQGHNFDPRI